MVFFMLCSYNLLCSWSMSCRFPNIWALFVCWFVQRFFLPSLPHLQHNYICIIYVLYKTYGFLLRFSLNQLTEALFLFILILFLVIFYSFSLDIFKFPNLLYSVFFQVPSSFFLKHVVNYCQCTFLVKTIFFKQAHAFLHLNAIKYSFTKHLYNFFLILSFISEFVSIHWFFSSLWVISSFFGPCLLILIWCQTLFFFLLESSRYTLIPINAIFFLSYLTSRINPVPDTQSAPEAEFQSRSPLNFSKCP